MTSNTQSVQSLLGVYTACTHTLSLVRGWVVVTCSLLQFAKYKFIVLSVYFLKDNVIINNGGCFRLLKPAAHESYRLSKSYFMPVSSTDSSPYMDGFY